MKKIYLHIAFLAIILVVGIWIMLQLLYPTTSPINTTFYFYYHLAHPHKQMTKDVTAFLPYWRINDIQYTHFYSLSEIIYFSLFADENGNIVKVVDNQTNPGWLAWNSQAVKDLIAKTQITGNKFTLTIAIQKNDALQKFLANNTAQRTLIKEIINQVQTRHLNGIVIDFEYDGIPDAVYRQDFTAFAKILAKSVKQASPQTSLTMTLYPLAIREKKLFDVAQLLPYFDRFIGMSYDYYGLNADVAGPVAPMHGFAEQQYFFDVTTTYQDYAKIIPKQKILMGIPYYGYDWAVANGATKMSKTIPSSDPNSYAAVISYARAKEDTDLKPQQCYFDQLAQSPWCWYTDGKTSTNHQVWFENVKSIATKFDFANMNHLGGIAIWVLGYDKRYADLWNLLDQKFTHN